jgi:hypothetical protein
MSILFIVKIRILFPIQWSYMSSQLCWLLSLEGLAKIGHVLQFLLTHVLLMSILRSTHSHTPLKYRCLLKICSWIRPAYLNVSHFQSSFSTLNAVSVVRLCSWSLLKLSYLSDLSVFVIQLLGVVSLASWTDFVLLCEQEIQTTLRDEIKSMCEYRPYENSDYSARITAEISVKKLECVLSQIKAMREVVSQAEAAEPS